MSNYVQSTNFATKDALPSGDPLKIVKGTEINTEFANIAIAVATKIDSSGALGTPTSGVLTNCTGLPVSTGVSGLGTGIATALAVNVGSAGAPVVNGGALGTPSAGVLTNATGLPLTTGVTGTLPVANGGTGATSLTANNVILGNGTSAVQVVAPSTSGNVLTSNGTTWSSSAPVQTAYQIYAGSGDTASKSMNVSLAAGTWQLVITATFSILDSGNYDFTNTATAVSNATTATASVRLVRSGGAGFGRYIYGTSTSVQTLSIGSTTSTTLQLGSVTLSGGSVESRIGVLTKIA